MDKEIIPWLPLLVTLVAGIFALFQIKSNNITNARLKWLDNLKQVLTDFLSECTILQLKEGVSKGIKEIGLENNISSTTLDYLKRLDESIIEHLKIIESKYSLIKLNLNPKEILHQKLEELLDDYMSLFNEIPEKKATKDYNALTRQMEAYSGTLVLLIRYIMKLEWEKTKRTYLSRMFYMNIGKGKTLIFEAVNLKLMPERPPKEK
jgi:hypothetical protein